VFERSASDKASGDLASHETIRLAVRIVAAYVGNNPVDANKISSLLNAVFTALQSLDSSHRAAVRNMPAVPVSKSVTADFIICLEDGKN
jgi:predicted transcriptional regulator